MTAQTHAPFIAEECRFVEVLTTPTARRLGYRLGGARPGPRVLIAGHGDIAERVFDRLAALPTLPWLRGELVLVTLESLDEAVGASFADLDPGRGFDEILFLPYTDDTKYAESAAQEGFRTALRVCARFGMIQGRGVH